MKYACNASFGMNRPVPAPTSEPSATPTPWARWRRSGNSPLPSGELLVGQCDDRRAAARPAGELGVGGVHVVGEHAARGDQTVRVVAVQVVAAAGEQAGHRGDLGQVLVDVRGEPHSPPASSWPQTSSIASVATARTAA